MYGFCFAEIQGAGAGQEYVDKQIAAAAYGLLEAPSAGEGSQADLALVAAVAAQAVDDQ